MLRSDSLRKRGAVVAALLIAACGGTTTGGTGGGGSASKYAGGACDTCDKNACAAERGACAAEADCAAYLTCLGACPVGATGDADPACEAACADAHGAAPNELAAFRACRTSGPGSQCPDCMRSGAGGAGGAGTCTTPPFLMQQCPNDNSPDACIQCQYEKCCDSVNACFGSGPAADLTNCWLACPDTNTAQCEDDCYKMFPDGIPGFAGYEACLFTQCGAPDGPCAIKSACNKCWYDECECEYATCMADTQCFLRNACFGLCTTGTCVTDCQAMYPDGKAKLDTLEVCITQRCGSVCGA